jgi:hypothetical protein
VVTLSGGRLYQPSSATGEYVVFGEPWVDLTPDSLTVQGRDPLPRNQIRFISHSGNHGGHFADPAVAEDVVVWSDGSRTTGSVLIRNGRVEQAGHPPRPFREVHHIELAQRS